MNKSLSKKGFRYLYWHLIFWGIFLNTKAQPWAIESNNLFSCRDTFQAYWQNKEIEKGKGYKPFIRWQGFWESRVDKNGNLPPPKILWQEWQNAQQNPLPPKQNGLQAMSSNGQWEPLGPYTVALDAQNRPTGLGRINCIAFHASDANTYWVGTPSGGLWKTTNNGESWLPLTDALPSLGVADLATHSTQPNTIFMLTGDRNGLHTFSYGVLKSTDGGQSWVSVGPTYAIESGRVPGRILWHPTNANLLFVAQDNLILRSSDGGNNWTTVHTLTSGTFCDMEFHPTNTALVYASTRNGHFYRSVNGGLTWSRITSGIPTNNLTRMEIAVSAHRPNYVYVVIADNQSGLQGVYRSIDAGENFSTRATSPNLLGYLSSGTDAGGQAWYDLAITANPQNAEEVYVGGINLWRSTNGGTNWVLNSHWSGAGGVQYVHADCHWLGYHPLQTNTLYAGNDGGIYRTANNGTNWTDISKGLMISQVRHIGARPGTELFLYGMQDNGTGLFDNGNFRNVLGADGFETIPHPTQTNIVYASFQYGKIMKSTNAGGAFVLSTNGINEMGAFNTPYTMSQNNSDILIAGYENIWRTTNAANTWTKLSSFAPGFIGALGVAPSNDRIIYCTKQFGSLLYKTINASTWQSIPLNFNNGNFYVTSITVHPTNPNTLWVTLGGYNSGHKVYRSTDGGLNWTNLSTGLPNLPVNCLVYHVGNSNDALYVGTDVGVYYRDNTLSSWQNFSNGLPNVIVNELEIDNSLGRMRAATFGRGVWQSALWGASICNRPTELSINNIGASTATVSWQASGNDGIEVSFRPINTTTWQSIHTSTSPLILTGLTSNTTYEIRIRAKCGNTFSNYTEIKTFTTQILCTLQVTATGTNPKCEVSIDGKLSAVASGGTLPYTYLWLPNGATTNNADNVPAGTYSIRVTDAKGCIAMDTVTLTAPPLLQVLSNAQPISAPGATDGSIVVFATGGTPPYQYSRNNGSTYQSSSVFSNLAQGGYTILVRDANGCTQTISVVVPPPAPCPPPTNVAPESLNETTTKINWTTISGINFYELSYRKVGETNWYTLLVSGASYTLTNLAPNTNYEYRIRSRCANNYFSNYVNGTFTTVKVCILPQLEIISNNPTCPNGTDGSAQVQVLNFDENNIYTYLWSNSTNAPTTTGLPAGTYSVTVSIAPNCSAQAIVTLTAPSLWKINHTLTELSCYNDSSGSVSFSVIGGNAPYTYLWQDGQSFDIATRNHIAAGTYIVTVQDASGCTAQDTFIITQPNPIVISLNTMQPTCHNINNGSISGQVIGGTPNYTYQWSTGQITAQANLNGLGAGTYTLTVKDSKGCNQIATTTLTAPVPLTANASAQSSTVPGGNDGNITLSALGGTAPYMYRLGNGTFQSSATFSGLTSGLYTITVRDANNCTITLSVVVPACAINAQASITNASCSGSIDGAVTLSISGGVTPYTFTWSDGATTQNRTQLAAGNYSVIIKDLNQCSRTLNIGILQPPILLILTEATPESFNGANDGTVTLTATGGTPPYTFRLGDTEQSNGLFTNLSAGQYPYEIKDANECLRFGSVTVQSNTIYYCNPPTGLQTLNISSNTALAEWEDFIYAITYEIELKRTATDEVQKFSTTDDSLLFNNLLPNNQYKWRVRCLCPASLESNFTEWQSFTTPCGLGVEVSVTQQATCAQGGNLSVLVNGGTAPYNYLWSNGQTNPTLTNVVPGNYSITVVDATNCSSVTNINLPAPPVPQINTQSQEASPAGSSNGIITILASGGTPPYLYALDNTAFSTNNVYTGLSAGTYTAKVRDDLQCLRTLNVTVTQGCGKPTGLAVLLPGSTTTTISWNPVVGATRYVIRYKEVGGFLTITRYRNSPNIGFTGLQPNKQYEVTVWAECGGQLSDPSELFYFGTLNARMANDLSIKPMMQVYPNPNQGNFTVALNLPDSGAVRLEVLDIQGKLITTQHLQQVETNTEYLIGIELQGLSSGLYFIRAITQDGSSYHLRFTIR